jgi:hypothetical protein
MNTGIMITAIIAIVVSKTNQLFVKSTLSNTENNQKIHLLSIALQKHSVEEITNIKKQYHHLLAVKSF